MQHFKDLWGVPSMLCSVHGTGGGSCKLNILWTTAVLVPLPPCSVHEPPPAEECVVVLDDGDINLACNKKLGDIDTFD